MRPLHLLAPDSATVDAFPTEFEQSLQGLRGALTEVLEALDCNPGVPQAMARRFGINKNLAWKVSKIVHAVDGAEALPHVPGPAGLGILLTALEKAGARDAELAGLRRAVDGFDRMIERHAGDRAQLELMIASSRPIAPENGAHEAGRKLAFQGNSAIFGVQAKVRFATQFIAPNEGGDGWLDAASLTGFVEFRRLRSTAAWPLVSDVAINDDDSPLPVSGEPLDPDGAREAGFPLIPEFCSEPHPEVRAVRLTGGTLYELCEGPVGNTSAFTCTLGWVERRFARKYRDERNSHGEHFAKLNTPCELVQFDLFVHRELEFAMPPQLLLRSQMELGQDFAPSAHRRFVLPHAEILQDLGSSPPVVATPHVPDYGRMVQFAADRMGHGLEQFRAYRLVLRYPPIPTVGVLRYPLLEEV